MKFNASTWIARFNFGHFRATRFLPLILVMFLPCCAEPEGGSQTAASRAAPRTAVQAAEAGRIDQQVAQILAGQHGTLPPAQPVRLDPTAQSGEITIKNETDYILTVLYSGPSSQSVLVSPHGTGSVTLDVGSYTVAARVNAADVQPFAGYQSLQGGEYENTFYIEEVRE